jgi:hypothetical protein
MQKLVGAHFYLVALCIAPIAWSPCARRPGSWWSSFCAIAQKSARPLAPVGVAPAWAIGNIGNMVTPEKSRRERSAVQQLPQYLPL